ncbi:MAG: taurine catabolism dioxygenase TauD [Rhodospirillaceae bacterium]|nr:taurine catabolism dioxygenase TauD [Rhodospirillaceae bacterium]|tara:strand:+ start:21397 stop:22257 length:861 start_codon:yes stop_codon:yes gene_type:complete
MTTDTIPFQLEKLTPHIGAEVKGIDLNVEQDEETMAALKQAWLENIVLLFRGQELTQEAQLRATEFFGEIGYLARPANEYPVGYDKLLPNVMLISNIRENGEPIGALPDGEMMFHHDMLHAEIPHKGTMLYSVEIPSKGGHTLFASGYAAYESLPDDIREPLEGRTAKHHYNYGSTKKGDGKGTKAFSDSEHPVFRTHEETGRKAIYVNRLMTEEIVGLPKEESDRLLDALFDQTEKPEFVYEHIWNVGDVLLWDNRCSSHARTDFPDGERRLMLRTTIEGDTKPY